MWHDAQKQNNAFVQANKNKKVCNKKMNFDQKNPSLCMKGKQSAIPKRRNRYDKHRLPQDNPRNQNRISASFSPVRVQGEITFLHRS